MACLTECAGQDIKGKMKITLTVIASKAKYLAGMYQKQRSYALIEFVSEIGAKLRGEATKNGKGMGDFKLANCSS